MSFGHTDTPVTAIVNYQQFCRNNLARIRTGKRNILCPTSSQLSDLVSITRSIKQVVKYPLQLTNIKRVIFSRIPIFRKMSCQIRSEERRVGKEGSYLRLTCA